MSEAALEDVEGGLANVWRIAVVCPGYLVAGTLAKLLGLLEVVGFAVRIESRHSTPRLLMSAPHRKDWRQALFVFGTQP